MAVKSGVDLTGFHRKMAAMRAAMPTAGLVSLRAGMDAVLGRVMLTAHRDTNRMVRGFAMAANDARLGPFPVPEVKPSKRLPRVRKDLARQVRAMRRYLALAKQSGDQKRVRYWEKALRRALNQVEQLTDTSILMVNSGRDVSLTVRPKIYGGTGLSGVGPAGKPFVTIVNREPHVLTYEKRYRTWAGAWAWATAGMTTVRRSKRVYVRELQQAARRVG